MCLGTLYSTVSQRQSKNTWANGAAFEKLTVKSILSHDNSMDSKTKINLPFGLLTYNGKPAVFVMFYCATEAENVFISALLSKECRLDFMLDFYYDTLIFKQLQIVMNGHTSS